MDAFVKRGKPKEANRADQRKQRAGDKEKGNADGHPYGNIQRAEYIIRITSPRIRNFASATEATKPCMPITSAASK